MSNKLSLEQYLRSKMTWFDYVCLYSWIQYPILLGTYMTSLYLEYPVDGRKVGLVFFISIVLTFVLRDFVYGRREQKRKEEWENL